MQVLHLHMEPKYNLLIVLNSQRFLYQLLQNRAKGSEYQKILRVAFYVIQSI